MGCELNPAYIDIANKRLGRGVAVDMFTAAGMVV
jgi:DNA modification methylase